MAVRMDASNTCTYSKTLKALCVIGWGLFITAIGAVIRYTYESVGEAIRVSELVCMA